MQKHNVSSAIYRKGRHMKIHTQKYMFHEQIRVKMKQIPERVGRAPLTIILKFATAVFYNAPLLCAQRIQNRACSHDRGSTHLELTAVWH